MSTENFSRARYAKHEGWNPGGGRARSIQGSMTGGSGLRHSTRCLDTVPGAGTVVIIDIDVIYS